MELQFKERLEALLNIPGLVLQLTEEGDSLVVVLNRPHPSHLDYVSIVDRVIEEVEISLLPYRSVQFYSRLLGEEEPDWTRTIPLGQQQGSATVIISSTPSAPTPIEESPAPTADSSKTQVIDNEETDIEEIEEEFNLPKPQLPSRQPRKPKPPVEQEDLQEVAAPTMMAPIPQSKKVEEKVEEEVAAETQIAAPPPRPQPKPPQPVSQPVSSPPFPWQSVLIAGAVVVLLGTIGWFLWRRNQSKPQKASTMPYVVILSAKRDVPTPDLLLRCRQSQISPGNGTPAGIPRGTAA